MKNGAFKLRNKPLASISLDLDDQWSYMKIHGDKGWETYPSYLNVFIPYVLDILDTLHLKITFFIVGKDAALQNNSTHLKSITDRGHEVGNHSFHHESWLKSYSRPQIEEEILRAEMAIETVTGQRPVGFRGPGFSWSKDLLKVLQQRGYIYDASVLSTYLGPVARFYYFWNSGLTHEERKGRKELFGKFNEGFRPSKPFYWIIDKKPFLEVPVTTMPFFKVPFHLSYLLYISRISVPLMKLYLRFAIAMCKMTKTSPSFLLHPLDLISGEEVPQLAFFPGMDVPCSKKVMIFKYTIRQLQKHFELVNMSTYAINLRNVSRQIKLK